MQQSSLPVDPLWYKDAIIYELHVKAFYDGNQDGIGDFAGLLEKLDYLEDLGINCVWLLPFYPSPLRDDGYDIAHFTAVHPSYGTLRDFRHFVREAHRRGIRVITELVVNHTSDQHPWFQAARHAPPGSSKRDFYVWSDTDKKYPDARIIFSDSEKSNWSWDTVAEAYYWHRFFYHQPDLNFDNPHVVKAIHRVMRYWLDMGVDGLRLDAIPYLFEREGTNCENLDETHAVLKAWRREMDQRYRGRMFLAEANQWPADVLPYFGDGDECHMSFHFPLMPRLFMALRQEDRHPIIEIMRQTPDIPPDCQWALFLRNHDELTLEMVSDEERDYMYREYAADPQARLNLGIRRRLAPLLGNSRRRIELLTSLLLSLPGTPIIYYGDEIGMGDNLFLGDRNGVRTPMQWTGDRNAGFSRADFARLYLPPIMDTVYGYQAVNVEAEQRDPSSQLSWMKRLIAMRKRSKAFGRGTLELLHPRNRKVLAYLRRYEEELFLVISNLSRFTQPAELDLAAFQGLTPVELFGRVQFPPIGQLPYFITLAPHSFCWFRLERIHEAATLASGPPSQSAYQLPPCKLTGGWWSLMEGRNRALLERSVLPDFLRRQRWFDQSRGLETVSIRDWLMIDTQPAPAFLLLLKVFYETGTSDLCLVPLAIRTGAEAQALLESPSEHVAARLLMLGGDAALVDALVVDEVGARLLAAFCEGRQWKTQSGRIVASADAALASAADETDLAAAARTPYVAQRNALIRIGNRLILKLYRYLVPGVRAGHELNQYLTEQAHFERVPNLEGKLEYRTARETTTLALLRQFIPNQGTGWQRTLDELSQFYERVSTRIYAGQSLEADGRSLRELSESDVPEPIFETVGPALAAAARLGLRTAELHLALARETDDPAFAPEPWTAADRERLTARLAGPWQMAAVEVRRAAPAFPPEVQQLAQRVLDETPRLADRFATLPGDGSSLVKIRCHGGLHLSHVLWVENDFVFHDLDGDPAMTPAERRAKQSPLVDVAGVVRSFDQAAYTGLANFTRDRPDDFGRLEPGAKLWSRWTAAVFLRDYLASAAGAAFLPADATQLAALLRFFLLEKLLDELGPELRVEPVRMRMALGGICDLLDTAH